MQHFGSTNKYVLDSFHNRGGIAECKVAVDECFISVCDFKKESVILIKSKIY